MADIFSPAILMALAAINAGFAVKNRSGFSTGAAVFCFGAALFILLRG